jgi:hypothetical protein
LSVGLDVGTADGYCERVGLGDGAAVGEFVLSVGLEVGTAVGYCERVGFEVGAAVGEFVLSVGVAVGTATGAAVPESNRKVTGASVGDAVGDSETGANRHCPLTAFRDGSTAIALAPDVLR